MEAYRSRLPQASRRPRRASNALRTLQARELTFDKMKY